MSSFQRLSSALRLTEDQTALAEPLSQEVLIAWIEESDPKRLEVLWSAADTVRRNTVGDAVHRRGLCELANRCECLCTYCGLRATNTSITRYRMTEEEILSCARLAVEFGYGTIVMQSGQDPGMPVDWMSGVIRRLKAETDVAITLSLGEHPEEHLAAWKEAGADRFLLRFETSNPDHYSRIHPMKKGSFSDRVGMLRTLKRLGYETGSGVLVGFPGQRSEDLANDLFLLRELGLHMIGIGPYVPQANTPMSEEAQRDSYWNPEKRVETALKMIALARLMSPRINIPSTTALATIDPAAGQRRGLERGANIVMPNLTPEPYRSYYAIYPGKAGTQETAAASHRRISTAILDMGRSLGKGRGNSLAYEVQAPNAKEVHAP